MIRYRVGARASFVISGMLLMVLGIIISMVLFINLGFGEISSVGLIFLVFFVAGAIIFGIEMYFWNRRRFALGGKLSTGVVVKVEGRWAGRAGRIYNLIIAYHNEIGEHLEASIPISYWDKDKYVQGVTINVYINGNYCYIQKY